MGASPWRAVATAIVHVLLKPPQPGRFRPVGSVIIVAAPRWAGPTGSKDPTKEAKTAKEMERREEQPQRPQLARLHLRRLQNSRFCKRRVQGSGFRSRFRPDLWHPEP